MSKSWRQRSWWIGLTIWLLTVCIGSIPTATSSAQQDCGVVDAVDYPTDKISYSHNDLGFFRLYFNGRHTGIDMLFDRSGMPVKASMRGRVTFSDPAGWDTEKGVVVLEHHLPNGQMVFSLYGHMEPTAEYPFPPLNACVERGQIIGTVGRPLQSAPHLHYEIRRMRASTGGPGYWPVDPLDGGWLHPIDFTEAWKLRFSAASRGVLTMTTAPSALPIWLNDGSAVLPELNFVEELDAQSNSRWRVALRGLIGAVQIPDGSILGRSEGNQIIILNNGRFVAAWAADRPLRSPPLRIGDSIVFIADNNTVVAYNIDGSVQWQIPLPTHVENYVISGALLALTGEADGRHQLWVLNAVGQIVYEGTAPLPMSIVPVTTAEGGFLILVASQVSLLAADMTLTPLLDTGVTLGRNGQAVRDTAGNIYVYSGQGRTIYAFAATGGLRWQATIDLPVRLPPLLAVDSGCIVYVLTEDGTLTGYDGASGEARGQAFLFAGGDEALSTSRFIRIFKTEQGEQVQFSAGYLSIATLDSATLTGLNCAPTMP